MSAPAHPSGIEALLAVSPAWSGLVPAASVVSLEGRWLLHAGPPLDDPRNPPAPILASAALACMHEGWCESTDAAQRAIRAGSITLAPAQQHRCVTPLAGLVSPRTSMVRVADRAGRVAPVHAPLTTLGGPDLRFGTRDARILERLRLRDTEWTSVLRPALAGPIDLLAIGADGIARGDDLHNRTTAATQILAARLRERFTKLPMPERSRVDAFMGALASTPLFFLTLWMAAAKLMLSAAEQGEPGTLITSMGGNGEAFGIALARRPQTWHTLPALAPQGPYLDADSMSFAPLGAIGDSAVIDALGFGGQALAFAPEPRTALEPYLRDAGVRLARWTMAAEEGGTQSREPDPCQSLLEAAHPAFARVGLRVGMDAARIVSSPVLPVVTLGMVEKTGERGLLGRGVMRPPRELFVNAVREIS